MKTGLARGVYYTFPENSLIFSIGAFADLPQIPRPPAGGGK